MRISAIYFLMLVATVILLPGCTPTVNDKDSSVRVAEQPAQEAAAKKVAAEVAAKQLAEEEAAAKKVAAEVAAKQLAEEEAAAKKVAAEVAAKQLAEEEAAAKKVAAEVAAKKLAEKEAVAKKVAAQVAAKQLAEEEAAAKKVAAEVAAKQLAEKEAAAKKVAAQVAAKKLAEKEAVAKKVAAQVAAKQLAEKEAVAKKAAAQVAAKQLAEKEAVAKKVAAQVAAKQLAEKEAAAKKVAKEAAAKKVAKPPVKEVAAAKVTDKKVAKQTPKVAVTNEDSGYGSVGGIIMVWKTKVETTGPRNSKDVIVYLESATTFPPVTDKLLQMDQRGLLFIPHVLAFQKGTSVEFLNNDPEKHNVFFLFDKTGETLDIGTWDLGQSVFHTFNETGTVITLCKLHLEMAANIIVLDNPYYTQAELDGDTQKTRYRIDRVPPGEYVLKTWHKKLKMKGGEAPIKVEAGKSTKVNIAITKRKYAK